MSMKLEFYCSQAFSSKFLSQFTPNATLSKLDIGQSTENPYLFRDLIELAKNLPNLQNLTLQWPAIIGSRDRTEGRWPERIRDHDIPEHLGFHECSQLA